MEKKYREYSSDSQKSGRHLLALVNTILEMTRMDSGKAELCEEVCSVRDIVAECFMMIRGAAQEERVALRPNFSEPEVNVVSDLRMLKQVLLNLLSNAVKFTPEGGQVSLSVLATEKDGVSIRIRDTGIDLSQADVVRIGQPFV